MIGRTHLELRQLPGRKEMLHDLTDSDELSLRKSEEVDQSAAILR